MPRPAGRHDRRDFNANGWAGAVIWDAVRDVDVLAAMDFGVKVLGSTPRKSVRRGEEDAGSILRFGGVEWRSGDRRYADADGVLLLPLDLAVRPGPRPQNAACTVTKTMRGAIGKA